MRLSTTPFLCACMLFCVLTASTSAAEVTLYRDAPDPGELADVLFPRKQTKTRAIVFPGGTTTTGGSRMADDPPKPRIAAMLIKFGFDSADIIPESRATLDALGIALQSEQAQGKSLLIEGHTDAKGSEEYNLILSSRRARAVKEYLVLMHRVEPDRLSTLGKGERDLLREDNPFGADNRRVQFRSVPVE